MTEKLHAAKHAHPANGGAARAWKALSIHPPLATPNRSNPTRKPTPYARCIVANAMGRTGKYRHPLCAAIQGDAVEDARKYV
jgi:hypothetical protein